ncbi:hypothetical protein EMPS_01355 [Entomortierella parvispora]|uniref:Phosphatidylcholine transfer protein n=1 Tax=Entomortierella parvispora TaxID=205924 RepID=A0A9P3LSL7_9FUNG|nr:hypothetical protein EMPS_01355 [Entomortierella parvispora]
MFTEVQVNNAIAEFEKPDLASWDLFSEVKNFKVYRRAVPGTSLKEYKVLGAYPDLPPRYLVRAYTDLDFRKTWDTNMIGWKALPNHRLHFVAKFPWPLYPRDYVYELRIQEFKEGVICINGNSVQDESTPERSDIVRVDEFRQDVVMQPTADGLGCNVWFGYYDDPKGYIPTSIINWAARSGIPGLKLMAKDEKEAMNEKTVSLADAEAAPSAVSVNC